MLKAILSKLKNWVFAKEDSDLVSSWEITRIGDPVSFMGFVLSNATEGSIWHLESIVNKEKIKLLNSFGFKKGEISLTQDNIKQIKNILPDLDIEANVLEQGITLPSGSKLLTSYDNLTCVWLSKAISEENIRKASGEYDFDYEDTQAYQVN